MVWERKTSEAFLWVEWVFEYLGHAKLAEELVLRGWGEGGEGWAQGSRVVSALHPVGDGIC